MDRVGIGVIGCGNISAAYLKAAKVFPDPRRPGARRPQPGGGRGARRRSSAFAARAVDDLARRPGDRDRPQPHGAEGACRGRPRRRSPPASTSIRRSRSASPSPRRGQLVERQRPKGLRARLRARHLSRRRASDLPQADRRRRHRPAGRRHRLLHVPRPRALASRARPSTTSPAAGRCSTWGPTTSPTSSTCSARSRASRASRRGRGAERTHHQRAACTATRIPVEVATHVAGTLRFVSRRGGHDDDELRRRRATGIAPIELYGTEGALIVPDPNCFGGKIELATATEDWREIADRARLCRRQLSHPRPCRHGAGDPQRPAAPRERRARLPRARSDGGLSALVRRGPAHRDRVAATGRHAADHSARASSIRVESLDGQTAPSSR